MKKLLTLLLLTTGIAGANVIPVENPEKLVLDELFPYQWGLLNQGQTLVREKDDIHNLPMKGVSEKDIHWRNLQGKLSERRPIVAILDSGVDFNHPELQGNLWTNENECGKDAKKDNDGNGLAGDCHGWNFTEAIDSEEAKNPSDIDGHGTHIAGIIAAANNGEGIVGVVPNALIMPVKVMKDSNSKSNVPSADSFARGIKYAVDNGADVINMSLGWPRALETKVLRDAVYYALGQGVPIVAAAGNNNSSEPLYPCAYDGVICVGATTINGEFASFSNFGGHVDTLAPGEGILGLNPTAFEPDFFSVPGFEIRSGTSQAAPFVAGMVAALKAKNKDIKIDEILARLYQGSKVKDERKYINGGAATWDVINAPVISPVVRPVFKNVRQITFRGENPNTKVPVTIRNFGTLASDITVRLESSSKTIDLDGTSQTISALNQGEFKDLLFDVRLKDLSAESNVSFKVIIEQNGESTVYNNDLPVVRDLRGEAKFKKATFAFADKPLPVGTFREGMLLPLISTVDTYSNSSKHEFFLKKTLKDEKRIELTLISRKGEKYVQNPNLIVIENGLALVSFFRVDLNLDGKEDYLVQAVAEEGDKKYFIFSFYNEDLKPLWPQFQNVKLTLDLFVENLNDTYLMKMDHPVLGKILVPAFFTNGVLPKVDQVLTSWDKVDSTRKKRLYYLEPQDNTFRIRSVITNVWEEKIKKEINSKWFETVEVEQILPVSETDAEKGQLRVLISVGLGTKRQLFIHTFDTAANSHGIKIPQLVLQSDSIDPLMAVSENGLSKKGEVYFNIYDRTRSKLVTTRDQSQVGEYIFKHDSESDLIAGHVASFQNNNNRFTVFQSREKLISVTTGTVSKRSSRPKLRYSFLSQKLLSEMYYPVSFKRNGSVSPALYVDATAVTGNRVYLFEEQNGELISSVKNSIVMPNGCKSLNPTFNSSISNYEFVFLCLEDKDFVIRTYEMN